MVFNQTFNNTTNVYNIAGSLILNAQSTPADLAREIATARATVDAAHELAPDVRAAATQALDAAEAESKAAQPKGATIKGYLDTAAETLEGAASVVAKAGGLAKTLLAIGAWAASVLT